MAERIFGFGGLVRVLICAYLSICRRANWIGRMALAMAVIAATLGSPVPTAWAKAGLNVMAEIECLALTIYFEARGEPDEGKIAVGHVVMNRAQNPLFPEKICGVVRQGGVKRYRCQFTWWCDGRSDLPRNWSAWERSKALARSVFWEDSKDPTQGALCIIRSQ